MSAIRIIGIGNAIAGDDAVGVLAARRLRDLVGDRAEVIKAGLAGLNILDLMRNAQTVILIDAACSGQPAGTLHRFDASATPVNQTVFPRSTHAFNAADALELGRALGWLPPRVILYGIEVGAVTAGRPLSPEVARSLETVVDRIVHEVEALTCTNSIS